MMQSYNPDAGVAAPPLAAYTPRAESVWPSWQAMLAVAVPLLIGGSLSPSSTFFNQVAATLGWGLALAAWGLAGRALRLRPDVPRAAMAGLLAALAVVALGILAAPATPWGQRLAGLGLVVLAGAVALASAQAGLPVSWRQLAPAVLLALLAAGLYSVVVGLLQVFLPDWTDGLYVAHRTAEGLAIGNIRQPNQLSTLLLWACAAAVWWSVVRGWPLGLLAGLLAALLFTVVLTASRTGVIGVVMLALWGLVDRRLPRRVRLLLLAGPAFYALAWWGMTQWAAAAGHAFHGGQRMTATLHGYGSDARVNTWLNTWALIKMHPWTGVGFGAYNFAWTLTPFPGRSTAFFDHSHNLLLQLAVELGLPAALLVLCLLAASLWAGRRGLTAAQDERAVSARTALFMLAIVAVHSLLEYPLWYAYFLLPTAALWGWYAGLAGEAAEAPAPQPSPADAGEGSSMLMPRLTSLFGALTIAASAYALFDFWRVATIFEPQILGASGPLAERIKRGRQGLLFGQHADYARVTMAERPQDVFDSFGRPLFHLLDTRLMIAYARALAGRGELEKARDVAARLREFDKPEAEEFFSVCAANPAAFQCGPDPALPYEALLPSKGSAR